MLIKSLLPWALLIAKGYAALLGIDIGEDFTKAVLVAPGVPFEIVMSADSKRKDVSGLAFKPLGDGEVERIYGSATSAYCTRFPQRCALNYKQLLGKSIDDPVTQHYITSHPGSVLVPSRNNRSTIAFDIEGTKYPVEELLAMNIQNIVSRASVLLKEKSPGGYSQIDDVAFTIPSYFTQAQRNAIIDAAQLAGLNVVALIDDGLAIAVNYASKTEFDVGKEYHILYDMGAGSTTATLVSFTKADEKTPLEIKIEGYAFDQTLGGSLFTNAVVEIVKNRFLEVHGFHTKELEANHKAIAKILQSAEKAKLVLSANNEAPISIESLINDIDFRTKITRQDFEEYLSEYSTRVTKPILDALKNQNGPSISLGDVKSVIYAGGSQRVPFVQKHLLSLIAEDQVSRTVNADEAAVFGATLRAVQISKMFKAKEMNISDSSVYNYRISVGDYETVVFPEGSNYDIVKQIDLTDVFTKDGLSLDLIEGSKRYQHFDTANLEDIESKYSFNKTDCSSINFIGNFRLSESRIFTLDSVQAVCNNDTLIDEDGDKTGFFDKLRGKKDEPTAKKLKMTNIPFKSKYVSSRPLGTSSKQELRSHIQSLNLKDQQRKLITEKLNELEATLYNARAYLDEEDVIEKVPEDLIEETTALVKEYLEWLDYESDGAKLKEIKEKVDVVKKLLKRVKDYIAQLDIPLDPEEFKRIHQEGVIAMNSFQETLMDVTEESIEIAKKFEDAGLSYEKEFQKLTKYARSLSEETVENASKALIKVFEKLKDALEGDLKLPRDELLELRKEALEKLEAVSNVHKQLVAVNNQRVKELNGALSRHDRALRRAAAKAAAKVKEEEEEAKRAENEKENEEKAEEFIDASETVEASEPVQTSTVIEETPVHDEL